ncbi:hypothetical protein FIBSPDRAFT_857422 [Athelia psychrophila]|uniref:Uncharacterized protein n=1 Tax=Athelia psychrophila TaxID=1759441 RepID=A0A166MTW2_9AGAM|nr:hypothetical protein FIBSPDRAFT_857422 [Fibularhizoctonia sp. CBS 109695]
MRGQQTRLIATSPRATPQSPSFPPSTLENGISAISAGAHDISDGAFRRMVSPGFQFLRTSAPRMKYAIAFR